MRIRLPRARLKSDVVHLFHFENLQFPIKGGQMKGT